MEKKIMCCILLMILLGLTLGGCIEENSLTNCVVIEGKGKYQSIQEAIDVASNGDTIIVYEGTYYESLAINKSISLIGSGDNKTVIGI